jgi:hypothetical protein
MPSRHPDGLKMASSMSSPPGNAHKIDGYDSKTGRIVWRWIPVRKRTTAIAESHYGETSPFLLWIKDGSVIMTNED